MREGGKEGGMACWHAFIDYLNNLFFFIVHQGRKSSETYRED